MLRFPLLFTEILFIELPFRAPVLPMPDISVKILISPMPLLPPIMLLAKARRSETFDSRTMFFTALMSSEGSMPLNIPLRIVLRSWGSGAPFSIHKANCRLSSSAVL